jgi:16S rRNA (uracil1498-N3)-methyltransferase
MAQLQRIAIAPSQILNGQITLTPPQQHYLSRVLRLQAGDRFIAMDGMGQWWLAQLNSQTAEIIQSLQVETELPIPINLIAALPKGNGFDEVVRCCTELGVNCITPVLSDRTLLQPSPQKLERWRKIAQEAAEQSERAYIPTILEPVKFKYSVSENTSSHRYFCESRGNYPHLKQMVSATSVTGEIAIVIGPEGGWTETEIELALTHGFQPVSLGKRILRAVTAPMVALSILAAELESISEK